jgi:rod shape-determining protein MreD
MIDSIFGRGSSFILVSIYIALVLNILPMGEWLTYLRPSWVLLVVLFWSQILPSRFGIWSAFFVGLVLDIVVDRALGITSISLILIVYLQLLLHKQLRVLSGLQDVLRIFIFSFLYLLLNRLLANFFGDVVEVGLSYWLVMFTNSLIWPWFYMLMDGAKTRLNIYEPIN